MRGAGAAKRPAASPARAAGPRSGPRSPAPRHPAARLLLAALLPLALAAAAGAADDERIYRWTDERGVPHFTDRAEDVPPAFRDQLGLEDDAGEAADVGAWIVGRGGEDEAGAETGEAGDAPPPWMRFDGSARRALEQVPPGMLAGGLFLLLVFAGLGVAFGAVILLVACRVVGQESPGFRKAYGIVIVQLLAGMVVGPGVVVVMGPAGTVGGLLGLQVVNAVATLLVHAAILRGMLCESYGRALVLALMMVVVSVVVGVVLALGFVSCGVGSALLRAAG